MQVIAQSAGLICVRLCWPPRRGSPMPSLLLKHQHVSLQGRMLRVRGCAGHSSVSGGVRSCAGCLMWLPSPLSGLLCARLTDDRSVKLRCSCCLLLTQVSPSVKSSLMPAAVVQGCKQAVRHTARL